MKSRFDEVIDREKTNSVKWNEIGYRDFFNNNSNLLSMWVADMDFKVSDGIQSRLEKLISHGIYGYSFMDDEYYEAIISWNKKRNNWVIPKESICFTPGVVPAINYLLETFTNKGDGVLIFTPVYYPFKTSILKHERKLVTCSLEKDETNYYTIDMKSLEKTIKEEEVKMIILCSPHNPVGRVWTKEELEEVGELCLKYNVLLIADEIHSDLIFGEKKFISYGNLEDKYKQNTIICTSPSKTFNLAAMRVSNIIIINEDLRNKFKETLDIYDVSVPTAFAMEALKGAYIESEEWFQEMHAYIYDNMKYVKMFIDEKLPNVKFRIPEGTYLGWMDFNSCNLNGMKVSQLFEEQLKIAVDFGDWFGEEGEGYIRINFACPRSIIVEALTRLEKYLNKK